MQLWWVQAAPSAVEYADDLDEWRSDARGSARTGRELMADLSFKVAKRRKEAVTFELEGSDHVYSFTPPKQADMVLPMLDAETDLAAARAAFEWLDDGLSEEDQNHLAARLKDKDDDLDIDGIEEVVTGLVERVSGRPTT